MAVVSSSVFRDSCEVIGNRYLKFQYFPVFGYFWDVFMKKQQRAAVAWNYKEWAELQDSTAVTIWIYCLIMESSAAKDTAQSSYKQIGFHTSLLLYI